MSSVFIFEDSENTQSSKLLKKCVNGANIYFANSNTTLYKNI